MYLHKQPKSLHINLSVINSVCTNMTGRKNDVATKFKQLNPFRVSIRCMAHRLNLATYQAAKAVPYVEKYENILSDI